MNLRFTYLNPELYMRPSKLARFLKKPLELVYDLIRDHEIRYLSKSFKRHRKWDTYKLYNASDINKALNMRGKES